MTKRVKITVFHLISAVLVAVSLCFTVFYFRSVARRTWQAVESFVRSLVYFVAGYARAHKNVSTTVQYIPEGIETLLPVTWEEVKAFACEYGRALISWGNFKAYNRKIGKTVFVIGFVLVAFLIPMLALFGLISKQYKKIDNKHGERSLPLRAWNKLEDIFYYPVKKFVLDFIFFFLDIKDEENNVIESRRARRLWLKGLALIWSWNLNLVTIFLEALAWIGYFLWSWNLGNIFVQIAKLVVDLSVAIDFLPWWGMTIIGYIFFNRFRMNIAQARLDEGEADNKQFLKDHPESLIATGAPRVGKTQVITDMAKSQEVIFREVANEKAFEQSLCFPHFPWNMIRQSMRFMSYKVATFSKATVEEWIKTMEYYFSGRAIINPKQYIGALTKLKNIGYQANDFICGYDYQKYGLTFDNGLKDVYIFEYMLLYALEYYIYTHPTPLIFGNYSIRSDLRWIDFGNYPIMDADFFRRTVQERKRYTQYSHIVNHDGFRLGVKMDPFGAFNDSYDMGIFTISEGGKERGNQITNKGKGDKGKGEEGEHCNQNNDLWVMNAKMISHACTIDYFNYFKIFMDEQRAMSILADFRELGSEINIKRKSKERITMPFFAFEEMLYVISSSLMKRLLVFMDTYHGKEMLITYIAKKIYFQIMKHYLRVYNNFATHYVEFELKNHSTGDGENRGNMYKYNLSRQKICSDVYDTGYFGVFYKAKFKRSKVGGLNNTPMFGGLTPTIEEMKFMRSHMNEELFKHFELGA